jgi:hypothetical protein
MELLDEFRSDFVLLGQSLRGKDDYLTPNDVAEQAQLICPDPKGPF